MIDVPSHERWVVLGLASPRSGWFSEVARWANAAAIPVEFVKCVSVDEVRARIASGRSYSALLVGSDLTVLDRDLVDSSCSRGVAVIVVGDRQREWREMGVSAVLSDGFERADLVKTLSQFASPVIRVANTVPDERPDPEPSWRGRLVAVTGAGGTGSSVVAMALAQGMGSDASNRGLVALADLALDADQAMLHDARELVPGLLELVEGHRGDRLRVDQVRETLFDVVGRDYHLLLGLRRHRDWTAIRPRAYEAALDGLQRSFRVVVADVEPDIEGESETGSLDVEDRNLLSRAVLPRADLVIVVGLGDIKGLHVLVRTVRDLVDGGVDSDRLLIAVNRSPRSPRRRAETCSALVELIRASTDSARFGNPVFLPERRDLESTLRDGIPLPDALGRSVTLEVRRRLAGSEPQGTEAVDTEPTAVVPGSLGHRSEALG